jgi:adenylate cyclase
MGKEIERKFLVSGREWRKGPFQLIRQFYLVSTKSFSMRIRLIKKKAFLTIKSGHGTLVREEFETPIPYSSAKILLNLHKHKKQIRKKRFHYRYKGFVWEIDEFLGANRGLVVAEIELKRANQKFPLPPWIAKEVTHDKRYLNVNLAQKARFTRV